MLAAISARLGPRFTGQANPLKVGPVGRFLYDAICFAGQAIKWCCWTAPWAAIALCLLLADIRIKPSLRKAVGFPRPIAYLLYAKRYGYFWREVLPLVS